MTEMNSELRIAELTAELERLRANAAARHFEEGHVARIVRLFARGAIGGFALCALCVFWLFWPAASRASVTGGERTQAMAIAIAVLPALPMAFWGASRLSVRHWRLFGKPLSAARALLLCVTAVALPGVAGAIANVISH
jgi:hypothetical protein